MPPRRSNTSKMALAATSPPSPPVASRVRKRGPSNADDSKQTKPKTKKQRAEVETDSEVGGRAQGSVKKPAKKGKKGKNR